MKLPWFWRVVCHSGISASALVAPMLAQRQLNAVKSFTISSSASDLSAFRLVSVSQRGAVAILQPQDYSIHFFDPLGKDLGTFGRQGEGPGEFRRVEGLTGWKADTLWVSDAALDRITFISPDRKLIRTVPDPLGLLPPKGATVGAPKFGRTNVYGVFPDGSFLVMLSGSIGVSVPSWLPIGKPDQVYFAHTTASGQFMSLVIADGLVSSPPECKHRVEAGSGDGNAISGVIFIPFCVTQLRDIATDGSRLLWVSLEKGPLTSNKFRLTVVSGNSGDTVVSRGITYQPVPIPDEVKDSVRKKRASANGISPATRRAVESMVFPKNYPPVKRAILGQQGAIWLEAYTARRDVHHWLVLDARGSLLGSLDLPVGVQVVAGGRDFVLGIEEDHDGLQNLVRFAVR